MLDIKARDFVYGFIIATVSIATLLVAMFWDGIPEYKYPQSPAPLLGGWAIFTLLFAIFACVMRDMTESVLGNQSVPNRYQKGRTAMGVTMVKSSWGEAEVLRFKETVHKRGNAWETCSLAALFDDSGTAVSDDDPIRALIANARARAPDTEFSAEVIWTNGANGDEPEHVIIWMYPEPFTTSDRVPAMTISGWWDGSESVICTIADPSLYKPLETPHESFAKVAFARDMLPARLPAIVGASFDFILEDGTVYHTSRDLRSVLRLLSLAEMYGIKDTFLELSATRSTLHHTHAIWSPHKGPRYGGPKITLVEWLGNNGIYSQAEPLAVAA